MTDKITLTDLVNLQNETTAVNAINANNAAITAAIDNTLSRDGTQPNQMGNNLDMNSHRVINLPNPISADEPLRLQDLSDFIGTGTIHAVPAGGVAGQILTKVDGTDYNVQWSNESNELVAGSNITITGTGAATIAVSTSPALTGTPTTPTAAQDTNTTQIASTAFVVGQASSTNPLIAGAAAPGTSLRYSRQDHVHPVDTSRQAADPQLFSNIPQNSQSVNYTLVLTDGEKQIFHPAADNNARTYTIPANASVAFPVGTVITFINKINTVTIAITTDTLTQAGTGATGSRTLAANGMATAIKITSTEWMISGNGLT